MSSLNVFFSFKNPKWHEMRGMRCAESFNAARELYTSPMWITSFPLGTIYDNTRNFEYRPILRTKTSVSCKSINNFFAPLSATSTDWRIIFVSGCSANSLKNNEWNKLHNSIQLRFFFLLFVNNDTFLWTSIQLIYPSYKIVKTNFSIIFFYIRSVGFFVLGWHYFLNYFMYRSIFYGVFLIRIENEINSL